MTNEQLKAILNTLPNDTILLIDTNDGYVDVETIMIEHHSDGRTHIVFTSIE
jgi:hypothetical protein